MFCLLYGGTGRADHARSEVEVSVNNARCCTLLLEFVTVGESTPRRGVFLKGEKLKFTYDDTLVGDRTEDLYGAINVFDRPPFGKSPPPEVGDIFEIWKINRRGTHIPSLSSIRTTRERGEGRER